jgi:hypothetical protein
VKLAVRLDRAPALTITQPRRRGFRPKRTIRMPINEPTPPRFRLLLIEDDAGREQLFRSWLPSGVVLRWAQSAGTALGIIRRDPGHIWSGVLLDHDLGERARTDDDATLSGTDVALALIEHFSIDIPILLHSTNRVQAPRVRRQLEQRGFWVSHIPFYDMTEERFVAWVEAVRELWLDLRGS